MKTACTVSTLVLAMLAANPVLAAGKKKPNPNAGVAYYKTIDKMLSNLTLTDDEEAKLTALKADNKQKFVDAYAKIKNVLTPDQQKAGEAAKKRPRKRARATKSRTPRLTQQPRKPMIRRSRPSRPARNSVPWKKSSRARLSIC